NRPAVAAQHGVAQAGFEPVPARRECAGDVAHVLVVPAKHGAEAVLLHHLTCALNAVFTQPVPVDPLLPIHTCDAEIRAHATSHRDTRGLMPTARRVSVSAELEV